MRRCLWIAPGAVAGLLFGGALLAGANPVGNLRLNLSASMPAGLWTVGPVDPSTLQRGQVVTFCLPAAAGTLAMDRGYIGAGDCPGGRAVLLKPVVGLPGDLIALGPDGVRVNGVPIANSTVLPADSAGRPVTASAGGVVAPGTVWVMSHHDPRSFDSRYFGAVPIANLRGVASPVLVTK